MLANLASVAANYRQAGIRRFVLAWSVRDAGELQGVRDAAGLPLRVAQLAVPLADIEQRLAHDVTSGRHDDLRAAAAAIASGQGANLADIVVRNDRPVGVVAAELMTFLGWADEQADEPAARRPDSPRRAKPTPSRTRKLVPVRSQLAGLDDLLGLDDGAPGGHRTAGLKLRALNRKYRLPRRSAFNALTNPKSGRRPASATTNAGAT